MKKKFAAAPAAMFACMIFVLPSFPVFDSHRPVAVPSGVEGMNIFAGDWACYELPPGGAMTLAGYYRFDARGNWKFANDKGTSTGTSWISGNKFFMKENGQEYFLFFQVRDDNTLRLWPYVDYPAQPTEFWLYRIGEKPAGSKSASDAKTGTYRAQTEYTYCTACQGRGKTMCFVCTGTGQQTQYRADGSVWLVSCSSCSNGQRTCDICSGTGKIVKGYKWSKD